ncbi:proximal tubules-expressed gene protein-like isoform X4 [Pseudophryne corroboree]|uniref:proximal tubules-expressed gene protein-like isoform X4 n=1 Tax=Pseudophryne corroboree TaxID=495146 RepID=UPI0030820656
MGGEVPPFRAGAWWQMTPLPPRVLPLMVRIMCCSWSQVPPQTKRTHQWDFWWTMFSLQLVFLILVSVGQITCQSGNKQNRTIPQWGTGLIAVAVFLFLVFAFYMANKIWNRPSKGPIEKSTVFDEVAVPNGKYVHHSSGFSEHEHEYDNPAADLDNDNELTTAM